MKLHAINHGGEISMFLEMAQPTERSRVNITVDLDAPGGKKKVHLPFRILAIGDYSHSTQPTPLKMRRRRSVRLSQLDTVMAEVKPRLNIVLTDKTLGDMMQSQPDSSPRAASVGQDSGVKSNDSGPLAIKADLQFNRMKDFHPDCLVHRIPELQRLLAARHLLKELRAHLVDNKAFKKILQKTCQNDRERQKLKKELHPFFPMMSAS